MDNLRQDEFLTPPLASISSKTQTLCNLGAEAILRLINGESVPDRQEVNSTFYLRRSFEID
jgi:DNA-binding LacI/PurR family transcriptional regulator